MLILWALAEFFCQSSNFFEKNLKMLLTCISRSDIFIFVADADTKHRKCSSGADSKLLHLDK